MFELNMNHFNEVKVAQNSMLLVSLEYHKESIILMLLGSGSQMLTADWLSRRHPCDRCEGTPTYGH